MESWAGPGNEAKVYSTSCEGSVTNQTGYWISVRGSTVLSIQGTIEVWLALERKNKMSSKTCDSSDLLCICERQSEPSDGGSEMYKEHVAAKNNFIHMAGSQLILHE